MQRNRTGKVTDLGPTMMLASAGGHLDELLLMVEVLDIPSDDAIWVTSRNAHTESVLAGRNVEWIPRVGSGEHLQAVKALPSAFALHKRLRPELLVTTGALFSTPHLLAARFHGCETWFIDSATRVLGPSSTGKFAQKFTKAKLHMQRPGWDDPRWTVVPGVFDLFERRESEVRSLPEQPSVVVSLGSEVWPFQRAIDQVLKLLPDAQVTWQTGVTEYKVNGERLPQWVPADELRSAIAEADVVVTHAGVGSVLACLEHGKVPVILPRRAVHGEMVDDHQLEFAEMIDNRGLAVSVDPADLTLGHLERAASAQAMREV